MINMNKNQYTEYAYLNRSITDNIIAVRRNQIQILNGKKPTKNISSKASIVLNSIFTIILETGVNELMASKSQLTKLLETDKSNTNRDIKTYFKGYGLGEYSFSNKYNITINGESKSVVRETHYYIYINKETLELMKSVMNIEGVDFDELIAQIPECERKCAEIGGKTETEIDILNYVDDEFIMKHKINVEKNLFTKEGRYVKETSVIYAKDDSIIKVRKTENDFVLKETENSIDEEEVIISRNPNKKEDEYDPFERMRKLSESVKLNGHSSVIKDTEEIEDEDEEEVTITDEMTVQYKNPSMISNSNQSVIRKIKPVTLNGNRPH